MFNRVGGRFGISDAAVSQASRRLILRAGEDQNLKKVIERVEEFLGVIRS
jgi:hypothetical protein